MQVVINLISKIALHRRLLLATTRVEFRRRYAGSTLGALWAFLNPLFFLAAYIFLFLVVFRMRAPNFSSLTYVVMVFSGLVPFLAAMEVTTASITSLKQNMHLIKNVIMPVDLIPVRSVIVAMTTQFVGLAVLIGLAALNGTLALKALYMLPLFIALQFMYFVGFALFFAPFGVLAPDVNHFIGTVMLLLMFVSPIAFDQSMIPPGVAVITLINPAAYLIESLRMSLLSTYPVDLRIFGGFALLSLSLVLLGASVMERFRSVVVDYE